MQLTITKVAIQHAIITAKKYLTNELRDHLSQARISAQLCILALLFAIFASCVILLFRLLLVWGNHYTQIQSLDFTGNVAD
ncbi:MAG: chloride channel protein, partial [Shewanella sp.]